MPNQHRPNQRTRQLLAAQKLGQQQQASNMLMTTFFLYRQTIRTVAYTRTYHDLLEIHSSVRRGRACIVTYLFTSDLPRSHRDTIVGSSRSSMYRYISVHFLTLASVEFRGCSQIVWVTRHACCIFLYTDVVNSVIAKRKAKELKSNIQLIINLTIIANVIEKMENDCVIMIIIIIIIVLFPTL